MAKSIVISDNCFKGKTKKEIGATDKDIKNLRTISDITLAELIEKQRAEKKQELLIFPQSIGDNGDGLEEEIICSVSNSGEDVVVKTFNIMGYISVNDTKLRIKSRFDNKNGYDDKQDFFLLYLLSKIMNINIFSWKYSESNQVNDLDFRMFMFAYFLHRAIVQGVFKSYKTFKHNDSNVRGVIDVPRHIRINNPFAGKIAYSSRQQDYDNSITQLIRHTIEFIRTKKMGRMLLSSKDVMSDVALIESVTPSYSMSDRQRIITQNLKPKIHPYFTEYTFLQKLCIQILNHESLSFGESSRDNVNGVLFDGAWLWEEYLNTILCKEGFTHPRNKENLGAIQLFEDEEDLPYNRNAYPDFYNEQIRCVLDAKYKHVNYGIQRDDLYQVIAYMHTMKYEVGGYMYPYSIEEYGDTKYQEIQEFHLANGSGKLLTVPFNIPQGIKQWKTFCQAMHAEEEHFKVAIANLLK